jgi:D-apiose dehydrogenase
MSKLRFVAIGAGFWTRFQLAGWYETGGVECVGIYNRTRAKAEKIAQGFHIAKVYDDPEEMVAAERPDFVDVITDVDTHSKYVHLAAAEKVPVVCQKPMAPSLDVAEKMVAVCRDAGIPFYVNENFRWQTPMRELSRVLRSGVIGEPFRARIDMVSGFPVFANQPFLRDLKEFVLTDVGSHVLDVARFLFGEANTLYCQTRRVHTDIQGEDVATVLMNMGADVTVLVQMGYAENYLERDRFPETFVFIEGTKGSVELAPDFWIRLTTKEGTLIRRVPPPRYPWADPAYDIVHSSIVPCQENLVRALRGEEKAETSAEDNIRTVRLVFASYESARSGKAIHF